jgi:hypothetical protein
MDLYEHTRDYFSSLVVYGKIYGNELHRLRSWVIYNTEAFMIAVALK